MACDNQCTSTGLAILPVRYAVVPKSISTTLPAWAQSAPLTGVPLENGDHYALRALRYGFLYVFYAKGSQGVNYWQCYSIAPNGSLWLQTHADKPINKTNPSCDTEHHDAAMVEFFCIAEPEKCGDVWLAFSQYQWSEATLTRYRQEESARNKRMQKIQPSRWINQPQQAGATQATADALQSVLDYQDVSSAGLLPCVTSFSFDRLRNISFINNADNGKDAPGYGYAQRLLECVSTLSPWALERRGKSRDAEQKMLSRSRKKDGASCTPLLLPLWDAIGIVHELNGWCMDIAGRQAQFSNEREFELKTHSDLLMVQGLIGDAAQNQLESTRDRLASSVDMLAETQQQRISIRKRFAGRPAMQQQLFYECDIVDQWYQQRVPHFYIKQRDSFSQIDVDKRKTQFSGLKKTVDAWLADYPAKSAGKRNQSWRKYKARLDNARRENFVQCSDKFSASLKATFDKRAVNILHWLEAELFIVTLQDYKSTEFLDNFNYCNIVSVALCGIGNVPQGQALIDRWIEEQSTGNDANLIWNQIAGNNPEIKGELEALLASAKKAKDDPTPTSLMALNAALANAGNLKKYSGFVSKALKESAKDLPDNPDWVNRHFRKTDLFMASLGDRIFNFSRLGPHLDNHVTMIYKLIFSVRAGVLLENTMRFLDGQLQEMPRLRRHILQDLKTSQGFLPEGGERLEKYKKLNSSWTEFSGTGEGKNTLKVSRVGLLMLFFNALDVGYLYSQLKQDDWKSKAALAASGLSMMSVISDLLLPALEKGEEATKAAIETVKLSGAFVGCTASVLTVVLDYQGGRKSLSQNRFGLACFYLAKGVVDSAGALKYLGTFLFAAGELASVYGYKGTVAKFALNTGKGITDAFLARTGLLRFLGYLASWQAQVGLILLQVVVTLFSDDELQVWCTQCRFGQKPAFAGYDEQLKSLESALKEIL
ncbi:T6SS effector BTH_I2691 family protein [Brenneria sp. g21c3]|uniref:T6SS effector BTH_I2691 family protein n=1 Tax=Brenneria sp. g21c3 TaxID=3093893 RepID=UPI002EBE0092|nr:T6SS effector BTH_I2691 family protein [Brenneria sp. g21c3]